MPRAIPLSTFLAVVFGGFVLAAVAVASALGWLAVRGLTETLLREKAEQAIELVARGVSQHLDEARADIQAIAEGLATGSIDRSDHAQILLVLASHLAARDTLSGLAYAHTTHEAVAALRGPDGRIVPIDREIGTRSERRIAERFELVREATGPVWGEVIYSPDIRDAIVNLHQPVRVDGRLEGVVSAGVTTARLSRLLRELAFAPSTRGFVLYGRDQVLAHPSLAARGTEGDRRRPLQSRAQLADPALARLFEVEPLEGYDPTGRAGVGAARVRGPTGSELVLFRELGDFGRVPWIVGFVLPDELVSPYLRTLRLTGVAAVAITVVALLLAVALGRLLARPVARVTDAVRRVSSLELEAVPPLPPSRLTELDEQSRAFNAMLATLRAFETYVPRSLVQRLIRAGRPDAVASRERDLTVMFTDIQGFTSLSETLPPAEVAQLLNEHFALLARCVDEEGGTVDKYLGDGMLAFWGAPEKIKNRAVRACRAALAIRAAIEADNALRRARGEPPLRVRIGLHCGPLVVGNIGAPGRLNYTVVGDTVNTAQRLMALARPLIDAGAEVAIVVSPAVAEETGGAFRLQPIGTLTLRGRQEPVEALELVGERIALAPEPAPPVPTAAA
jgi:class 3 adenylate cyclase